MQAHNEMWNVSPILGMMLHVCLSILHFVSLSFWDS